MVGDVEVVGKRAGGALRRDGVGDGLEGRVRLGVAEDVGGVRAGGPGVGVDGARVEGAGVVGEAEDVLFFEVLEETVEVG